MKRFLVPVVFVFSLLAAGFAQQSPSNSSSNPPSSAEDDDRPQLESPNAPPRSEPRGPMDSSSRDRDVDIAPPGNDNQHEGSDLLGPDLSPGVVEMKPWNPHRADKDV